MKRFIAHISTQWRSTCSSCHALMLGTLLVPGFCRYVLSFSFSWAGKVRPLRLRWLTKTGSPRRQAGNPLKVGRPRPFFRPSGPLFAHLLGRLSTGLRRLNGVLIFMTVLMQIARTRSSPPLRGFHVDHVTWRAPSACWGSRYARSNGCSGRQGELRRRGRRRLT